MTYFKYAERSADSQINWAEIGKNMSDMLKEEVQIREQKKAAIDKASREFGETLSNAVTGDYDAGNTFALEFANNMQQYRLMQDRLLKSGQLKLKDYTVGRQNAQDGTSRMFDLAKEYQDEYSEKMARWDGDESAFREVWEMEQAEGLANLRNSRGYINPTNGVVSIGRMVKNEKTGVLEMSKNPNDFTSVNELRQRLKQKYNRFDLNGAAAAAAEQLGTLEEAIVKYAGQGSLNTIITKIDAKQHDFGLEGEDFSATYKDWESDQVGAMMINKNDVASVLTDRKLTVPGTSERYTFTYDEEEWKADKTGKLIYLDRSKNAAGEPVFKDGQREVVEEAMRIAIRANIDVKTQAKSAGTTPYEPTQVTEGEDLKDSQVDVMSNIAALYYGDNNTVKSAASSIRGLNNNISRLRRTPDGIEFTINGKVEVFKFKDADGNTLSQRAFVEGIANKLLTDKQKIQNFDEIAKRGKIRFDKDFNPTSTGLDEVQEDQRLGFDAAFDKNEGAKFNAQSVLKDAGAAMSKAQEDAAVQALQTQIANIPGTDKIKVTEYGYGRGINVNIDGKLFEIDLKNKATVATQFEEVKKAVLAHARKKQNLILDQKGKESYIDQYGVIKAGSSGGELD